VIGSYQHDKLLKILRSITIEIGQRLAKLGGTLLTAGGDQRCGRLVVSVSSCIAPITGMLPLRDELFCRVVKFVNMFYSALQVITVLLTLWLDMVLISEG